MNYSQKINYILDASIFNFGDNYDYDKDEALDELFDELMTNGVVKLNESVDDNGARWFVMFDEGNNSIDFYKEDMLVDSESLVTKDDVVFKARVNYLLDEDKLYNLMMKYEAI